MTGDNPDAEVLSQAHLAQSPGNAAVRWLICIGEDTGSVRGPGWYDAECVGCGWSTSGTEPVVEQAAHEHVHDHHGPFVAFLSNELANAIRYQRRSSEGDR